MSTGATVQSFPPEGRSEVLNPPLLRQICIRPQRLNDLVGFHIALWDLSGLVGSSLDELSESWNISLSLVINEIAH